MKQLSHHERHLIDAAIAAGRVQHIPRGVSGLPTPTWNETTHQLVYPDGAAMFRRNVHATIALRVGVVPDAVKERRDQVLEMHRRGLNVLQIAGTLNVSPNVIRVDHHRLGLVPVRFDRSAAASPTESGVATAQRRAKVAALRATGMTARQISEQLGFTIACIESDFRYIKRVGVTLNERQAA